MNYKEDDHWDLRAKGGGDMKRYHITTPYGDQYEIDVDGCFLRYNQNRWDHPHDTWKCAGCAEQMPFGRYRFFSLEELLSMIESGAFSWVFKNQKPRYTLTDLDHGTFRVHGNTKWHGIQRAYVIED